MENSLISIVMPCKNTALFLSECLDSILDQTEQHWELLVVNDHSTDGSDTILQAYASKDERIKVFQNTGEGIIDALRLAYANCKGGFITRMDADDVMSEDKLSALKQNLLTFGKGHIALGLVKYFSETTLGDGFKNYEKWLNSLIIKGNSFDGIYKECSIPSPCWMVFKEDFEHCGAFRPNRYPEDYDLTFRFYENGLTCIPSDKVLHYWRDYAARTSRNDVNYADNSFIDIKYDYFIKLELDKTKKLVIWGAGKKGKTMARKLIDANIEFSWICDNPKKIGKHIYDKEMFDFKELDTIENSQSIITVANLQAQEEIKKYFTARGLQSMKDYYFFC